MTVSDDSRRPRLPVALGIGAILLPVSVAAAQVTLEGLGDLPGNRFESHARSVSADGTVVVGLGVSDASYGGSHSDYEGLRWQGGSLAGLGDLSGGDFASYADAVSGDGRWIVGTSRAKQSGWTFSQWRAAVWNPAGLLSDLGDLPGLNGLSTHARGVSADGSVIVGSSSGAPGDEARQVAVRWTAGGAFAIGWLEADTTSNAFDVSADGSVIVGTDTRSGYTQAWRWTAATGMVGLGLGTSARAVSSDGTWIVGQIPGGNAGRWSAADGWVDLGGFTAFDVATDGELVIGGTTYSGGADAVLWTPAGGVRTLDAVVQNEWGQSRGGFLLNDARGLNPAGTVIVGSGRNAAGDTEAYRLLLPRETWTRLGVGLAGTKGVPRLTGTGALVPGSSLVLRLDDARNSSPVALVIGHSRIDLPFFGGTFVPFPDYVISAGSSQQGQFALSIGWPAGAPSGLEVYAQAWVLDAAAVQGLAATDALRAVVR